MKIIDPVTFDQSKRLVINQDRNIKMIRVNQIMYCKANRNYTQIFLKDGSQLLASKTLSSFVAMLLPHGLLSISRSMLINSQYISTICKRSMYITMTDNARFKVARRRRAEVLEALLR